MGNDLGIFNPPDRDSGIIQVAEAVGVLEAVLSQNDVFAFAKDPDKDAPTPHWDIDDAAVSACFTNGGIGPGAAYKIAGVAAFQLAT